MTVSFRAEPDRQPDQQPDQQTDKEPDPEPGLCARLLNGSVAPWARGARVRRRTQWRQPCSWG